MQINRLFEIVYLLMNHKEMTAKELSEHFEVSQRTIYRDIDRLSEAGIPVYTSKGKGGGIRLLDHFVLNKSVLSEKEQVDILASLQSLKALSVPDAAPVLRKLAALFDQPDTGWIDVDFSRWGSGAVDKEKFHLIKNAILCRTVMAFDYYSSYAEKTNRTVEPLKLVFKGQAWYLYGYCQLKKDNRIFKVSRMKDLVCMEEQFTRSKHVELDFGRTPDSSRMVKLVLKLAPHLAYRVYDEFDQSMISVNEDGSFIVEALYPEDEWVYSYVLSYGPYAEVMEPEHIRGIIKEKLEKSLNLYS